MPPLFFDTRSGKLIDIPEEQVPANPLPQEVLPLAELVVARDFPFTLEDFSRRSISEWSPGEVKRIGTLVARDLAELEPPAALTKRAINRLHILGLFPHYDYFQRKPDFANLKDFRDQLPIEPPLDIRDGTRNQEYDSLTLGEIADLLLKRYNDLIELPEGQRFEGPLTSSIVETTNRMGLSPSRSFFERRYGGIAKLNEQLGWPNTRSMDEHDYIQYGVAVLRYNGPYALTYDNIKLLSAHHFGPDYETIAIKLGWEQFKTLARDELRRQQAQEKRHTAVVEDYYRKAASMNGRDVSFAEKAQYRALSLLLTHYRIGNLITLPARLKQDSVHTILLDLQKHQRLPNAEIIKTARILNIHNDLWPPRIKKMRPPIIPGKRPIY